MGSKKIIDSNVWVGAFDTKDAHHTHAEELLKKYSGTLLAPDFIAMETATVLQFKVGHDASRKFITYLFDNEAVEILYTSEQFITLAEQFVLSSNRKLSFQDNALVALSRTHEIITFDEALQKELKKNT